jgi:predicted DNA-binding transcriptional regulator AlpA
MSTNKHRLNFHEDVERNRLLRAKDVERLTSFHKTKRNELIKAGLFPKPLSIETASGRCGRTNYWIQGEIFDYLQARIDKRDKHLEKIATDGLHGWLHKVVNNDGGADHV